jgi:hypothetical protein
MYLIHLISPYGQNFGHLRSSSQEHDIHDITVFTDGNFGISRYVVVLKVPFDNDSYNIYDTKLADRKEFPFQSLPKREVNNLIAGLESSDLRYMEVFLSRKYRYSG